jgi:hypothetical protein
MPLYLRSGYEHQTAIAEEYYPCEQVRVIAEGNGGDDRQEGKSETYGNKPGE